MSTLATALVILVALEHVWFLVLEMFLWTKPIGLKTFRMTAEKARDSAALAANQGLYNGFLAAGLVWSILGHPARAVPGMPLIASVGLSLPLSLATLPSCNVQQSNVA